MPVLRAFSRVDASHLNYLALNAWAMCVQIAAAQVFCPHDISIIGDWMISASVMAGQEKPPSLGFVVKKAREAVLPNLGVPHRDIMTGGGHNYQSNLLQSGQIAPEVVTSGGRGQGRDADGRDAEPRWQVSLKTLVRQVL